MKPFLFHFLAASSLLHALDITVSESSQIQDALNEVSASGGGTVLLEKGIYDISETLLIGSNTTLKGSGNRESILSTTLNIKILNQKAYSQQNMEINNLTFKGKNNLQGGAINIISFNEDHSGVRLIDVNAYNTGWGVHIKGAKDVMIENCDFSNNGTVGKERFAHNLYLRRVYGAVITDSKFNDSTTGNGINISYSEDIEVYNSEMVGNYFRGIRSAESTGYLVHNCYIAGNGAFGIGANLEGGFTTRKIDIQNNTIVGNANEGIMIKNGSTGIIKNNNSYNNGTDYLYPGSVTFSSNISDPRKSLTTENVEPTFDAYTRAGKYSTKSYGSESKIILKNASSNFTRKGYMQFDVSTLEKGNTHLIITPRRVKSEQSNIDIYGVSDNWNEGVTWSTAPSEAELLTSISFLKSDIDTPVSIDISSYVDSQIQGDGVVSLSFEMAERGDLISFHSKESEKGALLQHSSFTSNGLAVSIDASEDAFVRGGKYSDLNYGGEHQIVTKDSVNQTYAREGFLKFSGTKLADITEGILQIPVVKGSGNIQLLGVTSNGWTENNITWANKPATSNLVKTFSIESSDAGNIVELDITDYLKSIQGDEVSLCLQPSTSAISGITFKSQESGAGFKLMLK